MESRRDGHSAGPRGLLASMSVENGDSKHRGRQQGGTLAALLYSDGPPHPNTVLDKSRSERWVMGWGDPMYTLGDLCRRLSPSESPFGLAVAPARRPPLLFSPCQYRGSWGGGGTGWGVVDKGGL